MKKALIFLLFTSLPISAILSQSSCPGDIDIYETDIDIMTLTVDDFDNTYSLGYFHGSVSIGASTFTTDLDVGVVVMKHDSNGILEWANQVPGPAFIGFKPVILYDNTNSRVIVAVTRADSVSQSLLVSAFSDQPNWTTAWTQAYAAFGTDSNLTFGAQILAMGGDVDSNGDFIISGAFSGEVKNAVSGTSFNIPEPHSEGFIIKIDQFGNEVWALQTTGGNRRGRAWTVEVDAANDILVGGHFTGTIDFGSGISYTVAADDVVNPYVAKLSSAGIPQWAVGMEGVRSTGNIFDIAVDLSNGIYFIGSFTDTVNIQGNTVMAAGGSDVLIGALTPDGAFQWAKPLGGSSQMHPNAQDFGTHINYTSSPGSLAIGGSLTADTIYYDGTAQVRPGIESGFLAEIDAVDGSLLNISGSEVFGYAATFNSLSLLVIADLTAGNAINIRYTQLDARPLPIADVTLEDGTLNPDEVLTAYYDSIYTYEWFKDGTPVSTAPTYTVTSNGGYQLTVTDSGGCKTGSREIFILDGASIESDSLVLVELYKNTNGDNWNDNTNWLIGPVDSWSRVIVNGGRVTDIHLGYNNLDGEFPQSIGTLSALRELFLDENNIRGSIPPSFWNLVNLVQLSLHNNPALTWRLESSVQNMTSLRAIRAFNTRIIGSLPPEIGLVSSLRELELGDTGLSGTIPPEVGNLDSLVRLDLFGNQLEGSVPASLGNLTGLRDLDLSENNFEGSLPDAIWQIPVLEILHISQNRKLKVTLPDNLNTLAQLRVIDISETIPIKGAFPTAFYDMPDLEGIGVGGHEFTGTLNSDIGNLPNLIGLLLYDNKLEGDFPVEINNLTHLEFCSIGGNNFTSFPDVSALDSLIELDISHNYLGFKDIIPNLSISNFRYHDQKRKPGIHLTVDPGGSLDLINDYTASGNEYGWARNLSGPVSTSADYSITDATLSDLGGYACLVTNPTVPDLAIKTPRYHVAFSGDSRSFTVDNTPNSLADFKSFYAASYGTNDGDTLYVAGSPIAYDHYIFYETPRVIYGPGYFLAENPETQALAETAKIKELNFGPGSDGSQVYGLEVKIIVLNHNKSAKDQDFVINDTLNNIHITGNKIDTMAIDQNSRNIVINKNFMSTFLFVSTPLKGASRSYQDIFVENNIIDTVTTYFVKTTATQNDMTNVVFDRNTIALFTDSIQDVTVSNSIISDYQATGNTNSNIVDYGTAAFENNSGTLSIDNDFIPTNGTVDAGAFSGGDPYLLSGIPPLPHIFELTNTGRIRISTKIKSASGATINKMSYKLGENGNLMDKGTVKKLEPGNPVEVLFRPRLGKVAAGGNYDLMLWAKDAEGKRTVHQNISFIAETTNATGNIFTADNQPITNGEVFLFEINQEGAAFDTLITSLDNQGAFAFSNIVVGDYLALGKANEADFPGQIPTYYQKIDLWEEADTLLIDTNNPAFDITLIAEPKDKTGDGVITGILEEEIEEESNTGRVQKERERVAKAGASVRRAVKTGRTSEEVYELVAFVYTNENGEFEFTGLPADHYLINIQYPGYPMDTTSDISIDIIEGVNNDYSVEALVADGKISLTVVTTTGLADDFIKAVNVYPNPTAAEGITIVFVDAIDLKGDVEIQLFDLKGILTQSKVINTADVNRQKEVYLPLNGIRQGTYLLKILQKNEEIATIRIIVH